MGYLSFFADDPPSAPSGGASDGVPATSRCAQLCMLQPAALARLKRRHPAPGSTGTQSAETTESLPVYSELRAGSRVGQRANRAACTRGPRTHGVLSARVGRARGKQGTWGAYYRCTCLGDNYRACCDWSPRCARHTCCACLSHISRAVSVRACLMYTSARIASLPVH